MGATIPVGQSRRSGRLEPVSLCRCCASPLHELGMAAGCAVYGRNAGYLLSLRNLCAVGSRKLEFSLTAYTKDLLHRLLVSVVCTPDLNGTGILDNPVQAGLAAAGGTHNDDTVSGGFLPSEPQHIVVKEIDFRREVRYTDRDKTFPLDAGACSSEGVEKMHICRRGLAVVLAFALCVASIPGIVPTVYAEETVPEATEAEMQSVEETTDSTLPTQETTGPNGELTPPVGDAVESANETTAPTEATTTLTEEVEAIQPETVVTGNPCGENLTWELDTGTGILTVTGVGDMYNTWWPYDIFKTQSFAPWHEFAADITCVKIDGGVTGIGHFAFFDCTNLTEVLIPEGVTFIGCAFIGCDALKEIHIPASVTDFRYPTNEGLCANLEKIIVSDEK